MIKNNEFYQKKKISWAILEIILLSSGIIGLILSYSVKNLLLLQLCLGALLLSTYCQNEWNDAQLEQIKIMVKK
jgi:hypothetical protein